MEEKTVLIPGKAGQLELKIATDPNAKIMVIICHPHPLFGGTMENKVVTTLFRAFKNLGATVIRFNYRGVGQSAGNYAQGLGETDDLITVCDWARKLYSERSIWLAGFSFGSYVSARAANLVHAEQLITVAPAVEHFNFDQIDFPSCPWLVIQGDEDEVVPPVRVFSWIEKQTKPPRLQKIIGASHFFHGKLTVIKDIIEQEFKSHFLCSS